MAMIKLTSDPDDESSIVSCIAESRENAGQVREQISSEMWERLNRLYHQVTQANRGWRRTPIRCGWWPPCAKVLTSFTV